jgi:signal transduction histidine kinase
MQLDPSLNEQQRERMTIIQHSGKHLLQLIEDILDLARIEAGKLDLCVSGVVLPSFLQMISEMVAVKAEQKRLRFVCEFASDLPGCVMADERRLRQALLNLLSNAVNFTQHGEVRFEVRATAPGRLRFAVHDTGIGIPSDKLEIIFQPFEQLGMLQQRSGGTGLGLPISLQLVQLMGGEIHAESALGSGSTFWFELELPIIPTSQWTLEPEAPAPENEPVTALTPPSEVLSHLHLLAQEGDMRDVVREAIRIASLDPRYGLFSKQVQTLARAYESKALLRLIESAR